MARRVTTQTSPTSRVLSFVIAIKQKCHGLQDDDLSVIDEVLGCVVDEPLSSIGDYPSTHGTAAFDAAVRSWPRITPSTDSNLTIYRSDITGIL